MASNNLAFNTREISEEDLAVQIKGSTKLCSGCDPDVPGHVARAVCKRCRGTGRENFAFLQILTEIREVPKKKGHTDTDDELYLET
jgi:hypothetical protein